MILDAENLFYNATALTATGNSDVVDLGADCEVSDPAMLVRVTLDVAADGTTGDETYSLQLKTDADEAFGSATNVGAAVTITRGDAAGTEYFILLAPGQALERYLRITHTLGGTTPTVTLTAALMRSCDVDAYKAYPDAITIS